MPDDSDISYVESKYATSGDKPSKCEFCKTNPCKCRFMICPFHGKVNAKEDSGKFKCSIKTCQITRTEKELES